MIGYTERATRCSGSRSRIEWSSTPAPRWGYMFWMAPIQTPSMPVRRSPKYFQVSESGPSGSCGEALAPALVAEVGFMGTPGVQRAFRIVLTTIVVETPGAIRPAPLPTLHRRVTGVTRAASLPTSGATTYAGAG